MNVNVLQRQINGKLRKINTNYRIKKLRRLPSGDYWFDLEMSFNSKDMNEINKIFRESLGVRSAARKKAVQAKFYLTEHTYQRLREKAAKERRSQSELVEEAVQKALS